MRGGKSLVSYYVVLCAGRREVSIDEVIMWSTRYITLLLFSVFSEYVAEQLHNFYDLSFLVRVEL